MFLIGMFVVGLLFLIVGSFITNKWYKRVDCWKDYPSNEEYWDCFAMGAAGLLLAAMGFSGVFFSIFLFFADK